MNAIRSSPGGAGVRSPGGVMVVALALAGCASLGPDASPVVVDAPRGLQLSYSIEKLLIESEAIAVVRVVATQDRVNNPANRLQDATRDRVHHYSELENVQAHRGTVPDEVRQTGGTVGEFTYRADDSMPLAPGETYLLFLTDWLWPFEDNQEPGTGITGGRAGIFIHQEGNSWANDFGLSLTIEELQQLVRDVPNDPTAGAAIPPEEGDSLTDP